MASIAAKQREFDQVKGELDACEAESSQISQALATADRKLQVSPFKQTRNYSGQTPSASLLANGVLHFMGTPSSQISRPLKRSKEIGATKPSVIKASAPQLWP